MFKKIKQFLSEAIRELGRVTWPSRATVLRMTVAVVIVSALFGLFAGLADLGITTALRELLVFKESRQATTSAGQNTPIQVTPGGIETEPAQ